LLRKYSLSITARAWFDRLTMIGKMPITLSVSKGGSISSHLRAEAHYGVQARNRWTLNETPACR
jgi:hypothetical protein